MTVVFGGRTAVFIAETYFNPMGEYNPSKSPLDMRCILQCCQVQMKPVEPVNLSPRLPSQSSVSLSSFVYHPVFITLSFPHLLK